jgi:hypothetical protein
MNRERQAMTVLVALGAMATGRMLAGIAGEPSSGGPVGAKTDLEYVCTGFENASPLQWRIAPDGTVHIELLYDYERNSPNRAAGHWHFQLHGKPGANLTLVLHNFDNVYNGRPGPAVSKKSICYVSTDCRQWRVIPTEFLEGNCLRVHVHLEGGRLYLARLEPYRISDLERLLDEIRGKRGVEIVEIGKTIEGRPLEIVRVGDPGAACRVLLRARAHPWEPAGVAALAAEDNPFEAPILDVRPRVFLRHDSFEGLTIDKLRRAGSRPEFAVVRDKWRARPAGRAILWMLAGKPDDRQAAVAGLKQMDAMAGTWSDRGLSLIELAALFAWLYSELDEPTRQGTIAKIERAADAAATHIRSGAAPYYYSRTPGALAGMAISGIALHGVSPKADEYLKLFRTWGVHDYFKTYEWIDGAATGATYTMFYTYVDLPMVAAAWWSATGKNPLR